MSAAAKRRSLALWSLAALMSAAALAGCGEESSETTVTVTDSDARAGASTGASGPTGPAGGGEPSAQSEAEDVVRRFYRLIDSYSYREAWALVPPAVRQESGGYANWRAGYRANVRSELSSVEAEPPRAGMVDVRVDLNATDVDACTGKNVEQLFSGVWTLEDRAGRWTPVQVEMEKVGGGEPRLSASECPSPGGGGGGGAGQACTPGYSPCLDPSSPDYDCEGGSGDGPDYVAGPVQVTGSDPYDLDREGDGVACE